MGFLESNGRKKDAAIIVQDLQEFINEQNTTINKLTEEIVNNGKKWKNLKKKINSSI